MDISSKDLKEKILNTFKRCAPPLIFDRSFNVRDKNFIENVIKINSVAGLNYYPELFDCNRFSLCLRANISQWQLKKYEKFKRDDYKYPLCIGSCLIIKDNIYHSICICLCDEGFLFIEPQSNELLDINTNQVIFVEF